MKDLERAMKGLSASERACYDWPDDTETHRQCRAAYVDGATDYTPPPHLTQRAPDRPKGNNADEWALWFFEFAGYGAQFLGVQIAEAIDEHIERTALLDRSQTTRILLTDSDHGVCVGGRWDGWLMWKHPDGQWVSVRKLELGQ